METYEQMLKRHGREINKRMRYEVYQGELLKGRQQSELHSSQNKKATKEKHLAEVRSFLNETSKKNKEMEERHFKECQKHLPSYSREEHKRSFDKKLEQSRQEAREKSEKTKRNVEEVQERMKEKILDQQRKKGRSR